MNQRIQSINIFAVVSVICSQPLKWQAASINIHALSNYHQLSKPPVWICLVMYCQFENNLNNV